MYKRLKDNFSGEKFCLLRRGVIHGQKCWKVGTSVGDVLIPYAAPRFGVSVGYRL